MSKTAHHRPLKKECATACLQAVLSLLGRSTACKQAVAQIVDESAFLQRAARRLLPPELVDRLDRSFHQCLSAGGADQTLLDDGAVASTFQGTSRGHVVLQR